MVAPTTNRPEVDYRSLRFDYRRSADHDVEAPACHPVVVIGAGPVGLTLAIDLAQRDIPVVVLDDDCAVSTGSRAICFAKRSLEIFDRLGCGDRMVAKGVSWNRGRVFFGDEQIYEFDLAPDVGHERPAFVNLQQYYVEGYLADRAAELPAIDLRWKTRVVAIKQGSGGVVVGVETPDGGYRIDARFVVACDGPRSAVRKLIGQESRGRTFRDRFLIADIRMKMDRPAERWFWFDPPFHRNQSVLLHMQPDNVWRIDFQLGWDADPAVETRPEAIIPRVKALLGDDAEFELEWASVYTFSCLRMASFRHGNVLFAGDSAHGVSPFGARGANSGIQDADNLGWKIAAVVSGRAGEALLDSYAVEREFAADENILNSTRATDFITPKGEISRLFRDAVLNLSKTLPFARSLVNSGRLSVPSTLKHSILNTATASNPASQMVPGAPAVDAPLRRRSGESTWLLRELGADFTALVVLGSGSNQDPPSAPIVEALQMPNEALPLLKVIVVAATAQTAGDAELVDATGALRQRYDLHAGGVVLFRPDQHVCARWASVEPDRVIDAVRRALAVV